MPPLLVPDASVILKWVFKANEDEPDAEAEGAVMQGWIEGKCEIVLPGLWRYEVGNVLGLKNPGMASEVMEALLDYRFSEAEMSAHVCRQAFAIMKKCGATFYDAAYHSIALVHDGIFVTVDEGYYKNAHKMGNIALLKHFSI